MAQKTIQCRLVASTDTRQQLWTLMAEQNTPLVNELIQQIIYHPDFDTWRQKGRHPVTIVSDLCNTLKTESPFSGQPARFYASAIKTTNYIFKSWLKLQKGLHNRLIGKRCWFDILKSDADLAELSGKDLPALHNKASRLLKQLENSFDGKDSDKKKALHRQLFQKYDTAKAPLTQAAIAYLLKHHCKLPDQPEDPDKLALLNQGMNLVGTGTSPNFR